jgi:hypothetical protein
MGALFRRIASWLIGERLPRRSDGSAADVDDSPLVVHEGRVETENDVLWRTGKVFRRP